MNSESYSLKSFPNTRLLEKLFMAILFTLRVFEVKYYYSEEIFYYTSISFCWRYLTWVLCRGFTSNKPIHCLIDNKNLNALLIFYLGKLLSNAFLEKRTSTANIIEHLFSKGELNSITIRLNIWMDLFKNFKFYVENWFSKFK